MEKNAIQPVADVDLTVYLWDHVSTGIPEFSLPWTTEDYTASGQISGFNNDPDICIYHQQQTDMLHLFHARRRMALLCIQDAACFPQSECSAPLRKIFGWWLSLQNFQVIHGAVLGVPGCGLLIPGKGGSGKSTTALTCVSAGLYFVSDDYCLLETRAPFRAYNLYGSAKISEATAGHFPDMEKTIKSMGYPDSDKTLFFPAQSHPSLIAKYLTIKAIAVPFIAPTDISTIEPIKKSAALTALAPSTLFQMPGAKTSDFYMLSSFVNQVPCYKLVLGRDRSQMASTISDFLDKVEVKAGIP